MFVFSFLSIFDSSESQISPFHCSLILAEVKLLLPLSTFLLPLYILFTIDCRPVLNLGSELNLNPSTSVILRSNYFNRIPIDYSDFRRNSEVHRRPSPEFPDVRRRRPVSIDHL